MACILHTRFWPTRAVGSVTAVIDPYGGKDMGFGTESLAYEYFMTHIRIPGYEQQMAASLAEIPKIDLLIGFSVGAAAVWGISGTLSPEKVNRAVCFYGSQIRHTTDIVPKIPMDHILPRKEPGFDVDTLAEILSGTNRHGSQNPFSSWIHESAVTQFQPDRI